MVDRTERAIYQQRIQLAENAILQGERVGYFNLGKHLAFHANFGLMTENGVLPRAKEMFKLSACLGYSSGMAAYADCFDSTREEKWLWLCRAAQKGNNEPLCREIYFVTNEYAGNRTHSSTMFIMGRVLQMFNLDYFDYKYLLRCPYYFDHALKLYNFWCDKARDAIICWMLIAKRFKLYKDVALLVAKHVWEGRDKDYFKSSDNRKFWNILFPK